MIVGETLLRQFRVDAFIASGGMGSVYRVWDLKRNVPLAMKVLHAELAEDPSVFKRFQREARALQKLAHPNIVPFYGLYQTKGNAILLERFIDGPSLKDILRPRKGRPLAVQEALIYLKALASALGYAHAHGVVHCDVKPGNVMVDQGGSLYLTDFGVARHAESATTTLGFSGTAAYMAPEQCRAESVTAATDIYALGVVLYEMLAGQRPFRGDEQGTESGGSTAAERIRYAQVHRVPADPRRKNPTLPEGLAAVILKAMAKEPQERHQSSRELFDAACTAVEVFEGEVPDRVDVPKGLKGSQRPGPAPQGVAPTGSASITPAIASVGGRVIGRLLPRAGRRATPAYWVGGAVALLVFTVALLGGDGGSSQAQLQSTQAAQTVVALLQQTETAEIASPRAMTTAARPTSTRPPPTKVVMPTLRPTRVAERTPHSALRGCAASRLYVGDRAFVSFGGRWNAIRSSPDTHPSDNIIYRAQEGEAMQIIGGPLCNYGFLLWEVYTDTGYLGWTPETDGNEFWLVPLEP